MPIWLQILLAGLVLVTTTGRRSDASTAVTQEPQHKTYTWNRFYALQTMLVSLSRSIEAVDTNLGVLVAGGIALFLYVRDHAETAVAAATAAHAADPPTYMTVFAWLLVGPILLAVIAMVKINARERPEPTLFLNAIDSEGDTALNDALEEMRATYEHNENIRQTKERIQTLVVLLFIAILLLDAVWPGLVHSFQAVERALAAVVQSKR